MGISIDALGILTIIGLTLAITTFLGPFVVFTIAAVYYFGLVLLITVAEMLKYLVKGVCGIFKSSK
jgi:hypothetical protein